jgi:hypothetical protein
MMKERRCFAHRYLAFLVGFMLALSGAGIGNADTTIAVPNTPQEHSQWCWAGTSDAVLAYYEHVVGQGAIANWAWGRSDCDGNTEFDWNNTCNRPNDMYGTSGSLQGILSHWGVTSNARAYALSQTTCVDEINAGRPFVMRFGWTKGGGHFLDGYGYDQDGIYLDYMDPWPGHGYTKSLYDWVVSASDHRWTHSLQITTNPTTCTYDMVPTSATGNAPAGIGNIAITASPSTCAWTATSNATSWITITSGSSGTGNGTVNYSYTPNNTGSQRQGTITAAGQIFTLTQPPQTTPIIQVTQSILNFGYVPPGSYKDLILEVRNIGGGILTGTVSATAPFSIVSGGHYSLGVDQSQQIIVRYTAPLQEGSQSGSIIFTGGGGITVQVKGTNKKDGLPWLLLLLGN